jgi:hypothetical protein
MGACRAWRPQVDKGESSVPSKKRPDPAATSGWDGEVRQDEVDKQVMSRLRLDGPRAYNESFAAARRLAETETPAEQIRERLCQQPSRLAYSGEDSAKLHDIKKISNTVEEHISRIRRQALEDALSGKPPSYDPPLGC